MVNTRSAQNRTWQYTGHTPKDVLSACFSTKKGLLQLRDLDDCFFSNSTVPPPQVLFLASEVRSSVCYLQGGVQLALLGPQPTFHSVEDPEAWVE